jgi:uncharacterized membrane protein
VKLAFGAVALVVLLIGGYAGDWAWTGFSDNDTLWDWLELLLLPIVIATLPIWLHDRELMDPRVRRGFAIGGVVFVVIVICGYAVPWDWTGFSDNRLWDWLGLLLLPLVLVTVGSWEKLRPQVVRKHIVGVSFLLSVLVAVVILGYVAPWEWTGFTGNTLWDWIQLVAVPLLLPLVLMPLSMAYVRSGIDERRVERDGVADEEVLAHLGEASSAAVLAGPDVGLARLEPLAGPLADDPRFHAVRAHLLELTGDADGAIEEYGRAASETDSEAEQTYLRARASELRRS